MKFAIAAALFIGISNIVFAQKTIVNPQTGFVKSDVSIKIDKIILTDTSTNLHFLIDRRAGRSVNIPQKSYIQSIDDTIKYYARSADSVVLGKWNVVPPSGILSYTLIFQKLPDGVNVIDFGENLQFGKKIYDIVLIELTQRVPDFAIGEWFNKNNGQLQYAFYNDKAIVNNKLWDYKNISTSKTGTKLILNNEKQTLKLKINEDVGKTIFITKGKLRQEFLKDRTACTITSSKEAYKLPIFKLDTAIYSGYIKNYTPRAGFKTIALSVDNLLSGKQGSVVTSINQDGYFKVKVPLYHPQYVYVRSDIYNGSDYLEPGKELFVILDGKKVAYTGELSALNYDLNSLQNIIQLDYNKLMKQIVNMAPGNYKDSLLNLQKNAFKKLDSIKKVEGISEKAYQVAHNDIRYRYLNDIMTYDSYYTWQYKEILKIDRNQEIIIPPYPKNFYDFINRPLFNNPLAVISNDFNTFVNRVMFLKDFRLKSYTFDNKLIFDELNKSGKPYSANDSLFLSLIRNSNYVLVSDSINEQRDNLIFNKFSNDHRWEFNKQYENASSAYYKSKFDSSFGFHDGFLFDVMYVQKTFGALNREVIPLTASQLGEISGNISNPFFKRYLTLKNECLINSLKNNKYATGYALNDVPKVAGNALFDSIMSKYKGKLVYVDFWATWCGPCMAGIEEIKSLKEDYRGKNIAFVYITDESSPEPTYNNVVPTIKGEHYRLKNDEYNYLRAKFNISGIPHYVLYW